MPVYKRKYGSGKVVWYYQFAPPGSTRQNQNLVSESGFVTKQEATAAEAVRRTEEQKKVEMQRAGAAGVAAAMPTTLAMLLAEFMKQHAQENLAPKTVERYREMAAYIAPELLAMNMTEITPLHLRPFQALYPSRLSQPGRSAVKPLGATIAPLFAPTSWTKPMNSSTSF